MLHMKCGNQDCKNRANGLLNPFLLPAPDMGFYTHAEALSGKFPQLEEQFVLFETIIDGSH